MSDNPKKANKEMEKAIFISADCWLKVFDLLPPVQLGLGIAMISRRFDYYVDEHFKTRKWTLDKMEIRSKIGQNGTKEMEIVNNFNGKELPIPHYPLPNKVIGFGSIFILFIDQNVLTFLRRFHRFFSVCATKLYILTENVRILEFLLLRIWPMFKDTIHWMCLNPIAFRLIRQLAPSLLNDYPSLRFVNFFDGISLEFPPDDSANASDGQAVAKWLFTPHPSNLMNDLIVSIHDSAMEQQWLATVEHIKAAFSAASSPGAFRISVYFTPSSSLASVVPFELTNEFTGENLKLSKEEEEADLSGFSLIRCPIGPDDKRQQQMIIEFSKRNRIDIFIGDDGVDDGLLDDSPGPSGDH